MELFTLGKQAYENDQKNWRPAEATKTEFIYQPQVFDRATGFFIPPDGMWSFEAYRSEKRAKEDWPNMRIAKYKIGDIEEPTFLD